MFSSFDLYENEPGSNYNSLQMKYQRQMAHGLQTLASYTWSHAIDWASGDSAASVAFPLQRGNADFDVRNNFTAALVYNLPTQYQNKFEKALTRYWNANAYIVARSAFPYEPVGPVIIDPVAGYEIGGEPILYFNREHIHLTYIGPSHSDSDISTHFAESNVLHAGDCWINGWFPLIDYSNRGSAEGYVREIEKMLAIADSNTVIGPGQVRRRGRCSGTRPG
jgi:hypothetical protein